MEVALGDGRTFYEELVAIAGEELCAFDLDGGESECELTGYEHTRY